MKNFLFILLLPCFCTGQFNPIFFGSGNAKPINPGNTNLIAYYKLDNDAVDATGLSPNGTATGIDYVAGKTGNAARFNAGTDRIDIADTDNLSFTDGVNDLPFSVSVWVYFTAFSGNTNTIISKRGTTTDVEWQLLYFDVSGKLQFQKYSGGGNVISQGIKAFNAVLNTWYHIVVTDDGSKTFAGMRVYVNGILQVSTDISSGVYAGMANGTSITRFGLNSFSLTDPTRAHQGYLEDIGIWRGRVLTLSEIKYLYNNGSGKTYPF